MKVLLVGSTGFIGRQIHIEMLQNDWQVLEVNRSFGDGSGLFDKDSVKGLLSKEEFDCVVSTAWTTSLDTYRDSNQNFEFQSATKNLALEVKRSKIGVFVALGSSAEYGADNLMASCIDSELKAVDAYSRSKIDTFTTLSEIFNDSQTRFIWPRIFQTFGRGQDPKRFIPYLISSFKNNISPEIINPSHVYDWIHVSDVAKAIIFSIKNQVEGAVDVGTSIGTSNKELANSIFNEVASATNSPIFSSINKAQGLVMSNKSVLLDYGWKPEVDLNCGIRELIVSKL